LIREEWRRSRQGKKVPDGRCGKTIEAEPLSGQTCLIEPAEGAPATVERRNMAMAIRTGRPPDEWPHQFVAYRRSGSEEIHILA